MKPFCLFTVILTSMPSLVLDLEQNAHMIQTLTDPSPQRRGHEQPLIRRHSSSVSFFLLACKHLKRKAYLNRCKMTNSTYPFIFNEPILFYGCFKRAGREQMAINGKHEATCWELTVRSMACLVMPWQTYISIIPFSNIHQNPNKKKRILTLLQSINLRVFQGNLRDMQPPTQ